MDRENAMQKRQDQTPFELRITDGIDWKRYITEEMLDLEPPWSEWCGGTRVPLETYLRKEAEVNDVSFERSLLERLLNRGFTLEELEVEFRGDPEVPWGVGVWYKEHPNYEEGRLRQTIAPKLDKRLWSFMDAVFKTEHAGDQTFSLFSMQMIGAAILGQSRILLHKSMIYRKAVLSPPVKVAAAA